MLRESPVLREVWVTDSRSKIGVQLSRSLVVDERIISLRISVSGVKRAIITSLNFTVNDLIFISVV